MEFSKQAVETLFNQLMASFTDGPQSVVSFFADDATIQFPFSGRNAAVMDRRQYTYHLTMILPMMHLFHLHNYQLYATDEPGTYWGTLDLEGTFIATGKILRQNYVIRFSLNNDMKIICYEEYGNPLKFMEAYGWGRIFLYVISKRLKRSLSIFQSR